MATATLEELEASLAELELVRKATNNTTLQTIFAVQLDELRAKRDDIRRQAALQPLQDTLSELQRILLLVSSEVLREPLLREEARLQVEVAKAEARLMGEDDVAVPGSAASGTAETRPAHEKFYIVKLTSYSSDQSDKFMKLYIDVPGLLASDAEKVSCVFGPRSVKMTVSEVENRGYVFLVNNLADLIKPKLSRWTVKKGRVVVFLCKKTPNKTWQDVSAVGAHQRSDEQQVVDSNINTIFFEQFSILAGLAKQPLTDEECVKGFAIRGHYFVIDEAMATIALKNFAMHPPVSTMLHILPDASPEYRGLYTDVLRVVGQSKGTVELKCIDSFVAPSDHSIDSARLDFLLGKRCILVGFVGYLSATDMARLPSSLRGVGLAIKDATDAAAVAGIMARRSFKKLCVSVARGVPESALQPLPFHTTQPYELNFSGVTDIDIAWLLQCRNKLLGNKTHTLALLSSTLTFSGALALGAALQSDGTLRVTIETERLSDKDKTFLMEHYQRRGCQLQLESMFLASSIPSAYGPVQAPSA